MTRRLVIPSLGVSVFAAAAVAGPAELRLSQFGGVADGRTDGSGTDNTSALRSLARAAAQSGVRRIIIEPGRYCFSGGVRLDVPPGDLEIEAEGAELIHTLPAPTLNAFALAVIQSAQQGGLLLIKGLEGGLARPSGRVAGTDFLRLQGFRAYELAVGIHSSDNMGVTINRTVRDGFVTEELRFKGRLGGREFDQPHAYGSIGDTGLWIPNGVRDARIEAIIRSTGDDGVFIGGLPPGAHGPARFDIACDIRGAGACGVKVVEGSGAISGRIARTNGPGVALMPDHDAGIERRCGPARLKLTIEDAGQLVPGDIGAKMIAKVHPHGLWTYGSVAGLRLDAVTVVRSRGAALAMAGRSAAAVTDLQGALRCIDCGGAKGVSGRAATLARARTVKRVADVDLRLTVDRARAPVASWALPPGARDGRVVVAVTVEQPGALGGAARPPAARLVVDGPSGSPAPKADLRLRFASARQAAAYGPAQAPPPLADGVSVGTPPKGR